ATAIGKVANFASGKTSGGSSGSGGVGVSGGRSAGSKTSRRISGQSPIPEPSPRRSSDPAAPRTRKIPGSAVGSSSQSQRQITTTGKSSGGTPPPATAAGNNAGFSSSRGNPRVTRQRSRSSSPSVKRDDESPEGSPRSSG
ncbi:unnamed protein product, partial [Sphacelaria rigidula]